MSRKRKDEVIEGMIDAIGDPDPVDEDQAPVEKVTYEIAKPPKELPPAVEALTEVTQPQASSVKLPVWAAVCGQKLDQLAGFVAWSRKHCPERLTLAAWDDQYEAFFNRPVR